MSLERRIINLVVALVLLGCVSTVDKREGVSIVGNQFYFNGEPTYKGATWNDVPVEGLLFNSRMVQGIFDDINPETRVNFKYQDTQEWDADRNTREFIQAMASWKAHGLLAFTLNLQGGSPLGYGNEGWINSAFHPDGSLDVNYIKRLKQILNEAQRLEMVVILGYFYFGQDEYLANEQAVVKATDNMTQWLKDENYNNVIIEIANECDIYYDHEIIQPQRVVELMKRVKAKGFLVSVSYSGGKIPSEDIINESDFILLHGNGVEEPQGITNMVTTVKQLPTYRNQPIVFNEDDHYGFEDEDYNLKASVKNYASWGYFDFRREGESFEDGFQSVPVDWTISSKRKKAFFNKIKEITNY